ncbi:MULTISPECIES: DUF2087 domain-containing protein [unclassified Hyphomonas]|uniref:DUF2087 domain-containing protein n=2 Tax=Hyphomonas TaxID=85 RepID=UPI000DBFD9A5|nr:MULTISPECIES: DUF2087 domain-containing protein [unclassified Hyphomonas]RAN39481.1 hypothetical protein HY26_15745 [Hyphomonas sp. GM-8P]
MNMLARANGFRNFQHLRAAHQAGERLSEPRMISKPVDHTIVERALNLFDAQGRLTQWSSRRSMQELCLWALWARLPANSVLNDKQITALLDRLHLFEDAALIRRELVDFRLVSRKADGSDYRRTEKPPTPEARALIRHLSSRS